MRIKFNKDNKSPLIVAEQKRFEKQINTILEEMNNNTEDSMEPINLISSPSIPEYNEKDVDEIFNKLCMENVPKELVEIRKKQILKHSHSNQIIDVLYKLVDMIGTTDNEFNRALIREYYNELVVLHSPIYFEIPIPEFNPNQKWEHWSIIELYAKYIALSSIKGWEDYYGASELLQDRFKNYQILDILNDLVVNDFMICEYDVDFDNLLDEYHPADLIPVKVKRD